MIPITKMILEQACAQHFLVEKLLEKSFFFFFGSKTLIYKNNIKSTMQVAFVWQVLCF